MAGMFTNHYSLAGNPIALQQCKQGGFIEFRSIGRIEIDEIECG
jgi:esterase/lipase superfamily enzyme